MTETEKISFMMLGENDKVDGNETVCVNEMWYGRRSSTRLPHICHFIGIFFLPFVLALSFKTHTQRLDRVHKLA